MSQDQPEAPAEPPAGGSSRRPTGTVGVSVVSLLAGLLFGTSASLAREQGQVGEATNLPDLIAARDRQVRELADDAEELRGEVEALQVELAASATVAARARADELAVEVGLAPVSGPSLRVTLDDAGYTLDTLPEGYSVDDVVVHQQDLQAVVNALWAGGAEAVMVQDQRIVATSSVQCVGNTLYLQGRVYSPPYVVTAIGDPDALQSAVDADPVLTTYRQWADAIGLGYAVDRPGEVEMPAFPGTVRPRHAEVSRPGIGPDRGTETDAETDTDV